MLVKEIRKKWTVKVVMKLEFSGTSSTIIKLVKKVIFGASYTHSMSYLFYLFGSTLRMRAGTGICVNLCKSPLHVHDLWWPQANSISIRRPSAGIVLQYHHMTAWELWLHRTWGVGSWNSNTHTHRHCKYFLPQCNGSGLLFVWQIPIGAWVRRQELCYRLLPKRKKGLTLDNS